MDAAEGLKTLVKDRKKLTDKKIKLMKTAG